MAEGEDGEGYCYFGKRYYDQEIGLWTSTDPAEEYHSSYTYVGNNPIIAIDPNGLDTYVLLYGDAGLGEHNVGGLFKMAAMTRAAELLPTLGKDDNIVLRPVSSVADISSSVNFDDLALIEYFGHGSWDRLYPGENAGAGTNFRKGDVANLPGKFVEGGQIKLNSCFGASGGEESIAGAFAKHYQVPATGSETGMTFTGTKSAPTHMVGQQATIDPKQNP
jgi:uncharacterized protein RhaS with RHS repeats